MAWPIRIEQGVAVVQMSSNPVNKLNRAFFRDCVATLDRLHSEYHGLPVVLTGSGNFFSPGIDFDEALPLFRRGNRVEVREWFREFHHAVIAVLDFPRLMIAAVNGHAIAGGFILAMACDVRVASTGTAKFGLNEVTVGVPVSSAFTEMMRLRMGAPGAWEAILSGKLYSASQCQERGWFQAVVPPGQLIDSAVAMAQQISPDCMPAYVHSKRMLLAPLLDRIETGGSVVVENETIEALLSPVSAQAQDRAWQAIKRK